MNREKQTFSVAELAERYGVPPMTILRWIGADLFPGARKRGPYENSPWVIPMSAVEQFESENPQLMPS